MINVITLQGRLTADPEVRQTSAGQTVARFTVASDRNYKDRSGERKADFLPCVAFRQTGEFAAKWLHKGDMIVLQGSMQSEQYTANDGLKRTSYQVCVDQISFASTARQTGEQPRNTATVAIEPAQQKMDLPHSYADDFPF